MSKNVNDPSPAKKSPAKNSPAVKSKAKKKMPMKINEKKKKQITETIIIVGFTLVALAVLVAIFLPGILGNSNEERYKEAEDYLENGDYTSAVRIFRSLGEFSDSAERAKQISIDVSGIEDAVFVTSSDFPCYNITEDGVLSFTNFRYKKSFGYPTMPDVFNNICVRSFASGIFANCDWIDTVTIPINVKEIPDNAFYNCSSLKTVELHDGIRTIGREAFFNCSSLESIEIPSAVKSIAPKAFYGCSALKSISLPEGVTEIFESEFQSCSSLESVEIKGNIKQIYNYAFTNCRALTSIELPETLKSVGSHAFEFCSSLEKVTYGGSREEWEEIVVSQNNEPLTNADITFKK